MKTLELAPLKDKKLRVILVEKEYDEPWWVTSPSRSKRDSALQSLSRPSMAYCDMVKELAEKEMPDYATEELGIRSKQAFRENNLLADVFAKLDIPFFPVEMDDFARVYLSQGIESKREQLNEILDSLRELAKEEETPAVREKIDRLVAYGHYLHQEVEEEVRQVQLGIRESWIAMGILRLAERVKKKRVTALHICSPRHFKGLMQLLQSLEVEVTPIGLKRILKQASTGAPRGMADVTGISAVDVVPVIKLPKRRMSNILFFLETDDHASPFDICVAYDAGFDAVVPYPEVTLEQARALVQDAIFSRGPKGVKHTCFFIGGRSVPQAREMAKTVMEAMVPPFDTAVVVDPHGAFSTSAALVAKAEAALQELGMRSLSEARVLVLAGTGPVGESVASLCAAAGAETVITSRKAERAAQVAERLASRGIKVTGIKASTPKEIKAALERATVVFATGAPGVQLVSKAQLKALRGKKLFLDANAVPPSGIESLDPNDNLRELAPGIYGIGALAVGSLKLKIQREMLTEALKNAEGLYDDSKALDIARQLLEEQMHMARPSYPKPMAAAH